MKIVHISDIHWRGLSRHAEFTRSFERFFEKVRGIQPDIIFVGGDLFHTKTSGISPEVIDRLAWMLKSMGDISDTYIVLGNHDGNLSNEDRQDAISPIVNAMAHPRIHLFKDSGNNGISIKGCGVPVMFNVFSCFDKPGWSNVHPVQGMLNIATFHGSVGGTKMDNGWAMPDSKAEAQLGMFQGYDFVLLGDIHKRQFLAERLDKHGVMKPFIAYPGSPIQQNFGEDENKGFLVWDIKANDDWDVTYVEVENYQPYITLPWEGTVEATVEALEGSRSLLPGSRYRVVSQTPLSPLLERQLSHELKVKRGGEEAVYKSQNSLNYDSIIHNGMSVKKTNLRSDRAVIHSLYEQFLNANTKKYTLSDAQILDGVGVIDKYIDKLNSTEFDTTRNVNWSLKSFEFDNLYRYGEGNKIDFDTLNGVVGVLGKNKIGKSALVGALMYALFNGSDRDGVTKNGQIMNQTKKTCSATVVVTVNGVDYRIERSSSRVELPKRGKGKSEDFDPEKTETKLNFTCLNPDGTTKELNGISRDETDKAIRKLLGTPQDFLMTSVATQRRMESFIDEGASARKTILNRFLDLDFFEQLHVFAKEDLGVLNVKTASFSLGLPDVILRCQTKIKDSEAMRPGLEEKLSELRSKEEGIRLWLTQHESSDEAEATLNLVKVQQELFVLKRQEAKTESDLRTLTHDLQTLKAEVKALQAEESSTDIVQLQVNMEKMKSVQLALLETNSSLKEAERMLQTQEKSVKKLDLVPCGDQFPDCLYIRDSHIDKKAIEATKKQVGSLVSELSEISTSLKEYQDAHYADKMSRFATVKQSLKELAKEQAEKEVRLSLLERTLKETSQRLLASRQREAELTSLVDSHETDALDLKKAELKEAFQERYLQEDKYRQLLEQIGRDKAVLEKYEQEKVESEDLLVKLKVLESVLAAFNRNGIPAIILKTQLPGINSELAKLLGGLVDFTITMETEPGSNVMDLLIEDEHSKRVLELGSGMEKMLASIAIRVALINLSSLPKSDIFVIDEGFNALDEEHIGKCLELLQTLKGYFKSILVISHMQRVKEASDAIIEVVSTGLHSKIEG